MARADKDKGVHTERDHKIKKLTKMIKAKERELEIIESKADKAKAQVATGSMSKGDYQRLNIGLARDRKAVRGAITRLERGRLNRERKLRDEQVKKEEKAQAKVERQEKRALDKQRRKEKKAAKGTDQEGEEE